MPDIEQLLNRWQSAEVLDSVAAARIRAWEAEQKRPAGLAWQGVVALILGGILLATGAAIALVGQIFNIEEHWPAAILLWAIAALAGWSLLQDQAQQILTLLLFPA